MENIEAVIQTYEQALTEITPLTMPVEWVTTMMNLGNAYVERILGDKAENIKAAIDIYKQAVSRLPKTGNEPLRAALQSALGNALKQYYRGNRVENIEASIAAYDQALTFQTQDTMPVEWATTMMNRGNAYAVRILGDKAENIEEAIQALKQALKVLTQSTTPTEWADTMNSLGNAYRERIQGDRAENIEAAIAAYDHALTVRTQDTMRVEWAQTMMNLGNAYTERLRGDRAQNLEAAIAAYKQSLTVRTQETMPIAWAISMMNLGNVYRNRIRGVKAKNIETAIRAFDQALTEITPLTMPVDWATIMNNLGNACAERLRGDRAQNLEAAIAAYNQALTVRTRGTMPVEWAQTINNLGNVYLERIKGDRAQNIESAIDAYQQALTVRKREVLPAGHRLTQRNLGNLYFREKRWREAETPYAAAIQAGKDLLTTAFTDAGRRAEISENVEMHNRLVQISLNLRPDPHYARQSLVYAESGKARTFLDQMSQGDFQSPEELPANLVNQERTLLEKKRQLEIRLSASSLEHETKTAGQSDARPLGDLGEQHEAIQTKLRDVWEQMNHYPQAQEYVALRRGDSPEWDDLTGLVRKMGSQTALVEFYLLDDQIVVFALRAGCSQPQVYTVPISQNQLLYRYLLPYQDEVRIAERQRHAEWRKLGIPLLEPLLDLLDDTRTVYFVPHGLLHLLPLHALTVHGEPFIKHYAVAYAPSAGVLSRLLNDRQPRATNNQALIMGYTPNEAERDIFVGEAKAIAQLCGGTLCMDERANGDMLRQHALHADIIHLSCHGTFDRDDPLNSPVRLADGYFTARDWMKLRLDADLVTLSACQTGIADIGQGDEIVGLTRALLYAGANSALVTLWSVNAKSTLEWMRDFYSAIRNGPGSTPLSKAQAFQQATLKLRAHNDDPYYWAPFILVGS